jgi:hypothetical protein
VLIFESKFTSIEAIIVSLRLVLGKTCLKIRLVRSFSLEAGDRWRLDRERQLMSADEQQLLQNKNNNNNKGLNEIQLNYGRSVN